MNNFRRTISAFVLLTSVGLLTGQAQAATARKAVQKAVQPTIDSFYVTPTGQLAAGSELTFTIEGTPRGAASVRVTGVSRNIVLRETQGGVYEGDYTISSRDRINPASMMRGSLRVGKLTATSGQRIGGDAPAAAPSAPVAAPAVVAPLAIQKFSVTPIGKIEPGADLRFALSGTPRGKASVTIEGVARDIPMQETSPGNYETSYTIRRLDNFPSGVAINAALEANGQVAKSRLTQMLITDSRPPTIRNRSPRDGENLGGNDAVVISATFDDAGGVGVDPKSVQILVAGRDVTRNATITAQYFTYRADVSPGSYPVEVNARDLAGNAVRNTWTFSVGAQAPAAVVNLPLQIMSHTNNAQVGNGPVEIRGRTAPDANIDIQVQSVASVAGFVGVSQQVYSHKMRADGGGNFGFTFQPQVALPGARYEVAVTVSKGDAARETKLVLFQR